MYIFKKYVQQSSPTLTYLSNYPHVLSNGRKNFFDPSYFEELHAVNDDTRDANHVMLLYIYKEKVDQLDLKEIAKSFIKVNNQRMAFFSKVCIRQNLPKNANYAAKAECTRQNLPRNANYPVKMLLYFDCLTL